MRLIGERYYHMTRDKQLSSEILSNRYFFKVAFAISFLGIAVYLPALRNHFFWDDVDFYGGLCDSLQRANIIRWLLTFSNGHLSLIPRIGYWIDYRFFNRSIIFWHLLGLILHVVSITSVFYIVYRFLGRFRLAIFLGIIFATSTVYNENILTTNSLNHLCAVAFTLLSLALLCRYTRNGNWTFYFFSVVIGVAAILSTAFGLLVFPAHFLFVWCFRLKKKRVLIYGISLALMVSTFLLFWIMGTTEPHENHLNIVFGVYHSLLALSKITAVKMLRLIGLPLLIFAMINVLRFWRDVNWRFALVSFFLAFAPLLMALSFRDDFPGSYRWARYHHLPVVGVILFIGLGLSTPNMDTIKKYFLPRKVGWYFLIIFFTFNSGYVFHKNLGGPTNIELRTYEDRLGEACLTYAQLYKTSTVRLPDVKTSLPAYPFLRDLIYVCRYSVPYSAHLNFELSADDDRLIKILNSDRRYEPIRSRLKMGE